MTGEEWLEKHREREIAPEDLGGIIRPGSRIYLGTGCSEPVKLTEQLVVDRRRFVDCEIIHFLTLSGNRFFDDAEPSLYRHKALFVGKPLRRAVNEGKVDYIPISLSDIPELISSGRLRIDVALLQVSPPDRFGYCSLGINVDINRTVFKSAGKVVAQVNARMPRTNGDSFVPFDRIDHFVRHDADLLEFSYPEPGEAARRIGRYCARIIEDGSTLQFGIGELPNAVLAHLRDKKDLAVYSEVLSDSVVDLIESGVVTCRRSRHPHVMTSFVMGSRRLYGYVDDNPFIEFRPTRSINSVMNIARNHKQVAINAALSVSITGQVNSDSIGADVFGGVGGQLDFTRGAALSRRGKPIICLPSVTADGKTSRIVATLEPAAGVVVPRSDVHYVVTEWGVAFLHGKSIRERVLRMIGIAHPDFRLGLLEEAKRLNFVYQDQILPANRDGVVVVYPEQYEWEFPAGERESVLFRPVTTTDERLLQDLYYELDEEDRRLRFFTPKKAFPHAEAQPAVNVDYESVFAIVGLVGGTGRERIVATAAYYLDRASNTAEVAFTVARDYRNRGLTRHMLGKLIDIAREKGIAGFVGEVLRTNDPMVHILRTLPWPVGFESEGDSFRFSLNFGDRKR